MWVTLWQLGVVIMTIGTSPGLTAEQCESVRLIILADAKETMQAGDAVTCEPTELELGYTING